MFGYTLPVGVWIGFILGLIIGAAATAGAVWLGSLLRAEIDEQDDFHSPAPAEAGCPEPGDTWTLDADGVPSRPWRRPAPPLHLQSRKPHPPWTPPAGSEPEVIRGSR